MGESTKFERVDVDTLIPYVNNAKQHSDSQVTMIAASIREFGFLNPVLIDKNKNVIAGHGRILAAKRLGLAEVPCIFVEGLSEAQRKAYILADNRLAEFSEWDMDLVMGELAQLDELEFDIDLTGFELPEITDTDEEDSKFDDIEKLESHYGVPYQGNKSRIADIIISLLPRGERLVDLFGGGGGNNSLRYAERQVAQLPVQRPERHDNGIIHRCCIW